MSKNLTLLTDLYQLTMAQGYWQHDKLDEQACFYAFYRQNPFGGGYAISCGADQIASLVSNFKFTSDDIAYLGEINAPGGGKMFCKEFLEWLLDFELDVDIDAVLDGTVVFPHEPLVRVTGPLLHCQLLETALLNGVNFQTLIATKSARMCYAANYKPIAEFGLRRAQGPDGGLSASRAAFIGGAASVANVLAGKEYKIPVSGTHAHSWVMSFDDELTAFRAYAQSMPKNCILLVDTYNVVQGVKNAITVAHEMQARGEQLAGIRIDSGDLAWLSKKARKMLDEAGLENVKIVLSNDLDEYTIAALVEQGACFDSLGVGTKLATAYEQAALGGVYKLSAIRASKNDPWQPRIKVSEETCKLTVPGVLDTMRFYNDDGTFAGDVIFDTCQDLPEVIVGVDQNDQTHRKKYDANLRRESMLKPLARNGKMCDFNLDATKARKYCHEQISLLENSTKRFLNPHRYPAGIERELFNVRTKLILQLRGLDSLY